VNLRHTARGHWLEQAAPLLTGPAPPPQGDLRADVVVVGGGYTGMWCAWHLAELAPDARIVLLEADLCGHGPSGRNGGFCHGTWLSLAALRERLGAGPALELARATREGAEAIGRWCEEQDVDAWYRRGGELCVSTAPAQDGVSADAVDGTTALALDAAAARARCDSPIFRGGVFVPAGATVHPARLAFGLRERLVARGAQVFEGSRASGMRPVPEGILVSTASGGRVRARTAVFALNASSGTLPPLRNRLTVSSSHIVCTEPVPDVIDALGWRGGEAISDGRALLHYMRTTRDDRIVFGWAGGRMAAGARPGGRMEVDHDVVAQVRADLARFFPQLAGRRIAHAWGGPIDVSPTHRPAIVGLPSLPAWAAFGYTGNGVAPSHLFGRTLAALALDRRDPVTRLPFVDPPLRRVPPEPLRIAGAALIRRALVRKEAAEEAGARPDPVSAGLAALPRLLGLHIVR
jgi:glycine/D-amino acid oxidase-like deaminating enzyme